VRELRALGLTDDGKSLVLVDLSRGADGERFRVAADERLRAALRSGAPRAVAAQAETRVESALSPREIQARLRAGATAEEVAKAAGIPVGRIQRYEAPILAERARVVSEARRASAPGPHRQTPGRPLGALVDDRLEQEEVDPDSVEWDARRRPDGTWLVTLAMTTRGPARATWSWDPQARRVRGVDAGATAILAPMPAPSTGPDSLTAVAEAAGVAPGEAPRREAAEQEPESAVARQAMAVGDDSPRRGSARTGTGRPSGLVVLAGQRGDEAAPPATIDLSDTSYDADVPGGVPLGPAESGRPAGSTLPGSAPSEAAPSEAGPSEAARPAGRTPLPDALLPGTAPASSLGTAPTRPQPGAVRPSRQERLPAHLDTPADIPGTVLPEPAAPGVDLTEPTVDLTTPAAPADTAPAAPGTADEAAIGVAQVGETSAANAEAEADDEADADVRPTPAPAAARRPAPAGRPSTARRRSAVPAWDDIMFGARRS
jgi:hypothetical protein